MTASYRLSLGIRREVKNQWERRVPLTPSHIEKLVKDYNANVYVQPSTKRIYPDAAYSAAGAILRDDLSHANVILGVKEVPMKDLLPGKTYMFFSHTHKGQSYNMPMLKDILDKKIRLLDYELLKNEHQQRLVQFSRFAGYAGMVDGLHSLGRRLLGLGYGSPFLAIGMSYMYRCLADARLDVVRSGLVIQDDGLPKELGPMTFVFTGNGNVTRGALHVFKCLPHEWVSPNDLKSLYESSSFDTKKVYGCQVEVEDYLQHKQGLKFDRKDYFINPQSYESIFARKVAPYSRFLLNGIFWDAQYPRLLTTTETRALAAAKKLPLLTLSDVSCDINGSMEFMSHASTIDDPYYMYDPITNTEHSNVDGPGIQIMSIDNLPSEMPLEASEYFGESLFPFVAHMAKGNWDHPVLKGAAITTSDGKLEAQHSKLSSVIEKYAKSGVSHKKKVLVLGSGYVAGPLIDYILKTPAFSITIASDKEQEALKLAGNRDRVDVRVIDVQESKALSSLIATHDLVVSLVPATMHPKIAEQCIELSKHMVTASYISPALASLDSAAKEKGVTLMNEIGLDPGIDHLTALSAFDDIKSEGGHVTHFESWCGGLPAPEASDNPLGYKFSWSPQGVLLAASNSASHLLESKKVDIPGPDLLKAVVDVPIMKGFTLEGYPNRDSLKYISLYNLNPSKLRTMFRGTLRYKGFAEQMDAFKRLGLLKQEAVNPSCQSWLDAMRSLLGSELKNSVDQRASIAAKLNLEADNPRVKTVFAALKWMNMFCPKNKLRTNKTYFDAFCSLLQNKLVYAPGERDMVVMHHIFGVEKKDGKKEQRTSTMIAYGDPQGYSAMAKTVGLPAAIAAEMILNGQITEMGVIGPMNPEIYEPMLKKLEGQGIRFVDKKRRIE